MFLLCYFQASGGHLCAVMILKYGKFFKGVWLTPFSPIPKAKIVTGFETGILCLNQMAEGIAPTVGST